MSHKFKLRTLALSVSMALATTTAFAAEENDEGISNKEAYEKAEETDQPGIINDDNLDDDNDNEGGFGILWKIIIPILLLLVIFGAIGYYYYVSQQESNKVVPNVPDKTMNGIKKFTATASKQPKKSGLYKQPEFGASALDMKPYPSRSKPAKIKNLEKQRKSTMSKLSTFDDEFDKKKEKSAIEGFDKKDDLKKLTPKPEPASLKTGPKTPVQPAQTPKPQQKAQAQRKLDIFLCCKILRLRQNHRSSILNSKKITRSRKSNPHSQSLMI